MDKPNRTLPAWVLCSSLLAVSFFLIFVQANHPSLDTDGIHYAAVAKEIARSNRWLLPFDPVVNQPHYWHFPLTLWATAGFFKWLGVSPAAAKLYSLLSTLAAVGGLFVLGRMLVSPWAGWCAGLAFLLTDHVLRIGRQCRPDLPLIAFLVWGFIGLLLAQNRSRWWYLLLGLASCGAIMTKEMVGLIPLVISTAYLILSRQWREFLHPAFGLSWVLAIGPVAAWAWTEQARYGTTLWAQYHAQNFSHLLHAQHLATPWYYYGWAILDKYWYFLPLTLAGAWMAIGKIRRGEDLRWWVILLWAAALPMGFSLAQHKIHYYILPTYAATALLVGLACERWIRGGWRVRVVAGVFGIAVAGAIGLACFPVPVHKTRYEDNIRLIPRIDPLVAQDPGEVIVAGPDVASLLFYSEAITRVTSAHQWPEYREMLSHPGQGRRYCLIGYEQWARLAPEVRSRWKPLVDDGKHLFLQELPAARPPVEASSDLRYDGGAGEA